MDQELPSDTISDIITPGDEVLGEGSSVVVQ